MMNLKRTATIVVVGGAFAAWLSAAIAPVDRAQTPRSPARATPLDSRGAELAGEIARLHERLRPDATPRQPSRNLFSFRNAAPKPSSPVTTAPVVAERFGAPAPPPVALKLIGIAEDSGADGPTRTAIINSSGQLFFVREGEGVTSVYRVTKIFADAVELADTRDSSIRRVELK